MRSTKSKTTTPSRSSHRASRTRAPKPAATHSVAHRNSAPAVTKTSLAKKVLAKVKTKTGIALVAGAVLAGVGGLAYKYRTAR